MKKYIKCPVCGKETISIKNRFKLDYRYKTKIKCSNCNSELRESKWQVVLMMATVVIETFIITREIHVVIKSILVGIVILIYLYLYIYAVPLVKYDK